MKIILSYRGITDKPGWATGDMVARAMRFHGHQVFCYGNYYRTNKRLENPDGQEFPIEEADRLLWMECNDGDPQYIPLLDLKCKKAFWDFDSEMHFHFSHMLSQVFKWNFAANPAYVDKFPRSHYLPYAVDTTLFYSDSVERRGVRMLGNKFPQRQKFCNEVGVILDDSKHTTEYARALRRLKIHLHYYSSGGKDLIVCRPLETMASGTMLLAQKQPALDRIFDDGKDYVSFTDEKDCKAKIDYYMKHDEERERIAKSGQDRVLNAHSYLSRTKALLKVISK